MNPQEAPRDIEDRYHRLHDALMAEAEYHYNAMTAMESVETVRSTLGNDAPEVAILIQTSIAWSLMGLLRARIRERPRCSRWIEGGMTEQQPTGQQPVLRVVAVETGARIQPGYQLVTFSDDSQLLVRSDQVMALRVLR